MSALLRLLPEKQDISAEIAVSAARAAAAQPLAPGSDDVKKYCGDLSALLLGSAEARSYPELQALGFWLRPASVDSMVKKFLSSPRTAIGIAFHMPPSNVATLFGYTSSIALLCGNAVLVRLPSAENPVQTLLVSLMQEALAQNSRALRERLILLRYGHDDAVTSELSRACQLRMVWGSDETVEHISALPLPAAARHVSFGDRYSAMALKAAAWLRLNSEERNDVIKQIFNDIYVFDQLACASPRLLVWVGDEKTAAQAAEDFYPRLASCAKARGYMPGAGESIAKQNTNFLALHDLAVAAYTNYGPQLTVLALTGFEGLSTFKKVNYGYGTLLAVRLETLAEFAPHTEARDQTLSCWGFAEDEMQAFAGAGKRRGFDRMVAAGQALTFDPVWDGCNLFDAMTRPIGKRP
ncbi:MAG: acyl-CoA reductase [Alphaproteobacteria bacterium]|nr:acyl-CoA reductase [Alphaproteobacteria bacterium]